MNRDLLDSRESGNASLHRKGCRLGLRKGHAFPISIFRLLLREAERRGNPVGVTTILAATSFPRCARNAIRER